MLWENEYRMYAELGVTSKHFFFFFFNNEMWGRKGENYAKICLPGDSAVAHSLRPAVEGEGWDKELLEKGSRPNTFVLSLFSEYS